MASLLDPRWSEMIMELIQDLESRNISNNDSSSTNNQVLNKDDARIIPEVIFQEATLLVNDTQTCCAICKDDFAEGDVVKSLLPCHHLFHKSCVLRWLTQYKRCCPLCMRNIEA